MFDFHFLLLLQSARNPDIDRSWKNNEEKKLAQIIVKEMKKQINIKE